MLSSIKQDKTRFLGISAALLAAGLFLTACNTIEGAGRDIEATGETISDAADDAKN